MTYKEAINYIHSCSKFGMKPGLERISKLLDIMGNPQKSLKFIHIAGTNGKGSTSSFVNSILVSSNYTVGMYTSPFVQHFGERIQVNNKNISNEDIAKLLSNMKEDIQTLINHGYEHPTEFEIITAMAFKYFCDKKCDIVVLETGLGGKLDATNVIETPEVAVITVIGYDHMAILGNKITDIAAQKAGIIKSGATVVLYPQEPIVAKVFEQHCLTNKAIINKVSFKSIVFKEHNTSYQKFDYDKYTDICIKILGENQVYNSIMAINVAEELIKKGYNISSTTIKAGLLNATWSGRFEVLKKDPYFVIDAAHNSQGAEMLGKNLQLYFSGKKIVFIFGVLSDKEYKIMIDKVKHLASRFVIITPETERALSNKEVAKYVSEVGIPVITEDNLQNAVKNTIVNCKPDEVICAFGSLYYIGDIKSYIQESY
jgi:dihydrofolate synthase / folylpolyglutamate synthase